jgi:8-oxo-dGTP diphosphatase
MKVTVDAVVFGYTEGELKVLLIKRKYAPFKGMLAFPGGYMLEHEGARTAVTRELKEETNIEVDYLEQLYTFTKILRDPRGRTITIAYYALVNPDKFNIAPNTDATHVQWITVKDALKELTAFDHKGILEYALVRLRNKIKYEPIGFDLLPEKFTFNQLHSLYETILDKNLDRANFQKKFSKLDIIVATKEKVNIATAGKKPKLFLFDKKKYEKIKKSGFLFDI